MTAKCAGYRHPASHILLFAAALGGLVRAQTIPEPSLPPDAVVIERAEIPTGIHSDRELVLWMLSPQKHDRGNFAGPNSYSCPETTLGSYYSGPTRISLLDSSNKRVINTVTLRYAWSREDSFDVPYRILADYYYLVPGHEYGSEGVPALLALRDLNGDGLPLEAAFFEAEACMGLNTTLIGYSPKQDKVIQYEVELKVKGRLRSKTSSWVDYLFAKQPIQPGRWSYLVDYSGRGGALDSYDVQYDPSREKFFGKFSSSLPKMR